LTVCIDCPTQCIKEHRQALRFIQDQSIGFGARIQLKPWILRKQSMGARVFQVQIRIVCKGLARQRGLSDLASAKYENCGELLREVFEPGCDKSYVHI
jgi:hypothetical protein